MTSRQILRAGLVGALCVAGALLAGAQQQAKPLKPGQLPINDQGDVLTRDIASSRRWTLRAQVRLLGAQPRALNPENITPTQFIRFDKAQFVYPLIGETASSVPYPEEARMRLQLDRRAPRDRRVMPDQRWPVNENVITNLYETIEGYQGPTSLMRLTAPEISSNSLLFQIELDVRTWETRIDEARADAIEWPTEPWPPQLVSNLEPHLYVNPEHPAIQALLARFINGKDPRDVRPYALAKHLAGRVVDYIEFRDTDLHSLGRSSSPSRGQSILVNGFRVNGSVSMALTGEGSRFDAPALLCALYRAAGLPARLVIGYDADVQRKRADGLPEMRSWVEFALLDEDRNATEWIPVDITRQRDFSDRAPPLDQRWQHFGHNEEFDFVIPISHHWHPPTTVTNDGPPALWGWLPEPVIPAVDTEIIFEAGQTPTRATDPVDPFRR